MKKINNNICYLIILFFTGSMIGWFLEMIAFKSSHSNFTWIEIILNLRGVFTALVLYSSFYLGRN